MRLDEFIAQLEAAGWRSPLDAQHQRITELWRAEYPGAASYLDDLAALRAELQKVRSAAISGMDAATQHGHSLVQQAARLKAESNPDALESERAANALLTEQLQKAEADLAALRAERDAFRAAGKDALHALTSSRVFVTSRERCHHPDGTAWYDERVERLRAALGER